MENKEIVKIAKKVKKGFMCALASAGAVIGTSLIKKAVAKYA